MRISQLQNLCWAANGLVLLGVGFVVMQFVQTYKDRGRIAEVAWPETDKGAGIDRHWPGDIRGFTPIWEVPVNGAVPEPPKPVEGPSTTVSPEEQFRQDLQYVSGILFLDAPDRSTAQVRYRGNDALTIGLGDFLAGSPKGDKWQFIAFFHDLDIKRKALVFRNQQLDKVVRIEEPEVPLERLTENGPFDPVPPDYGGPIESTVARDRIEPAAWPHHEHPKLDRWIVPASEVEWWERYGEEEVLAKLSFEEHRDAAGISQGMKITSIPGRSTPVEAGRGIYQGDVIKSINGVPVRTPADIVRYLRGDGRGLDSYEILIEGRSGIERTVTYEIRRPRRS